MKILLLLIVLGFVYAGWLLLSSGAAVATGVVLISIAASLAFPLVSRL